MSDFLNSIKPILLVGFAIGIMFGLMSPKKLQKMIAMWALGWVGKSV